MKCSQCQGAGSCPYELGDKTGWMQRRCHLCLGTGRVLDPIEVLKLDREAGTCAVCGGALGRGTVLCGAGECKTVYQLTYRLGRTQKALKAAAQRAGIARARRET